MSRSVLVGVMCTVLSLGGVGCGHKDGPGSVPTTVVPVDCSPSMRGDSEDWPRQITRVASEMLAREQALVVGCFFGRETTVHFGPTYDGHAIPRLTGGEAARRGYAAKWARQLEPVFARDLVPHDEGGTNWLGALETAAKVNGVRTIVMFSDLVQQAEGVDLTASASDADLERFAEQWSARLARLKGLQVIAVGGGQGVARPEAARRGEKLFFAIRDRVGFDGNTYPTVPDPRTL